MEVVGGDARVTVAPDATYELRMLVKGSTEDRRPLLFTATDVASGHSVTAQDVFLPAGGQ